MVITILRLPFDSHSFATGRGSKLFRLGPSIVVRTRQSNVEDNNRLRNGVFIILTHENTRSTSAEEAGSIAIQARRDEIIGKATVILLSSGDHISRTAVASVFGSKSEANDL